MFLYSIGFAIAFHTRKEGFLLLLPIIGIVILSWMRGNYWWKQENRGNLLYPLIVTPIVATIVIGCLLASVNYARWGVFARYELAAPQYVRAVNALMAIAPIKETPRHVTVVAETRNIAYRASPTFAQLQPYFEGRVGQNLARMTSEMESGVTNEIGDWIFYWAIRDAAASVGWHSTATNAETQYKAIADELEQAFLKGTLNKRSTLIPFVDPDWKKWIEYLPESLLREFELTISPSVSLANLDRPSENATPKQLADFSLLLGRRKIPQYTEIVGWVIAPPRSLIGLRGNQGGAWNLLDAPERPDVIGAIPFSIRANTEHQNKLYVRLDNGKIGQLDLTGLSTGQIRDIASLKGVRVGIDSLFIPSTKPARLERLNNHIDPTKPDVFLGLIAKVWSLIDWVLLGLTLLAIFISIYRRKLGTDTLVIAGIVSLVVLGRVGLFGILDASSWYGQASRYMFPAIPFFITSVILGTVTFFQLVCRETQPPTLKV